MHGVSKWDDIRFLNACLEHGSVSAAAAALGVQQSTVSRRLAALEDGLGAPLFTRTSEGVVPTALAEKLRADAAAMEQHLMALERAAAGHEPSPSGRVRIALLEPVAVYGMLPRLQTLTEAHPELQVELVVSQTNSDLTRGEADLALRFARPTTGDLIGRCLAKFPLKVLASQRYVESYGPPRLDGGRWVNVVLPFVQTPEEHWFGQHVCVAPWLQTNSYVTATEAIIQGQAVGLTTSIIEELHPELQVVEFGVSLPPPLEMWLVTHRSMRNVPRIAATWDWLCEQF